MTSHELTAEDRDRGRETQRKNREQRRRELEEGLDNREALDVALDALVTVAKSGEGSERVTAAKEILHQLVGRPATVVAGDSSQPVKIVVESIAGSKPVREP